MLSFTAITISALMGTSQSLAAPFANPDLVFGFGVAPDMCWRVPFLPLALESAVCLPSRLWLCSLQSLQFAASNDLPSFSSCSSSNSTHIRSKRENEICIDGMLFVEGLRLLSRSPPSPSVTLNMVAPFADPDLVFGFGVAPDLARLSGSSLLACVQRIQTGRRANPRGALRGPGPCVWVWCGAGSCAAFRFKSACADSHFLACVAHRTCSTWTTRRCRASTPKNSEVGSCGVVPGPTHMRSR